MIFNFAKRRRDTAVWGMTMVLEMAAVVLAGAAVAVVLAAAVTGGGASRTEVLLAFLGYFFYAFNQ